MNELIIHGMRMPKEGDVIRIVKNPHGQLLAEWLTDDHLMTTFHPLREIPEMHGRIIDEQEFIDNLTRQKSCSLKSVEKALSMTETII